MIHDTSGTPKYEHRSPAEAGGLLEIKGQPLLFPEGGVAETPSIVVAGARPLSRGCRGLAWGLQSK